MHVHYSAELYDKLAVEQFADFDKLFIERLSDVVAEHFGDRPVERLLDVGTGTARLLLKVAVLEPFKKTKCVGTDYFQDMIDVGLRAVAESGVGNVELFVDDAHRQKFPDDTFDVIISRSTIHHWSNPQMALSEVFRVLRPGGCAILHEPRRDPNPEALKVSNENRKKVGVENNRLDEKYTIAEVEEFLRSAGILGNCSIFAPETGPGSMGFELMMRK